MKRKQAPYYQQDADRYKRTDAVAADLMEQRAREKAAYDVSKFFYRLEFSICNLSQSFSMSIYITTQ